MISHPLALTESQMSIVRNRAKLVPPQWRERYLSEVADQLLPLPLDEVDDFAVQAAALYAFNRVIGALP